MGEIMYFDVNWNYVRRFCDELPDIYRQPKKRYLYKYEKAKPIKPFKFPNPQFRVRMVKSHRQQFRARLS